VASEEWKTDCSPIAREFYAGVQRGTPEFDKLGKALDRCNTRITVNSFLKTCKGYDKLNILNNGTNEDNDNKLLKNRCETKIITKENGQDVLPYYKHTDAIHFALEKDGDGFYMPDIGVAAKEEEEDQPLTTEGGRRSHKKTRRRHRRTQKKHKRKTRRSKKYRK